MNKLNRLLIIAIFFLAVFLRFYQLGSYPPVFNRDEAAIGYNAFTILTTGKDEYGKSFPLVFRSFGDYKMPLYIYLTAPVIKIFGSNEFSVRFMSAFFGSLTVILIYFLLRKITTQKYVPLIAAFLLAIAPFHIFYSRLAFEANVALFFFIFAIYLFYAGLKKPILFIFSSLFFTLSLFCYFTPYFFVIPIIILLFIFNKEEINWHKYKIYYLLFLLITSLGLIFAVKSTILANSAKTNITIFKDQSLWEEMAKNRLDYGSNQGILLKLFGNQYVFYAKKIIQNYFLSYNANFLFIEGGLHPWHKIPGIGNLYLADLIFFLAGLYAIFSKKSLKDLIIIFILLLAPIPSAISTDAPHTTRLLFFLVTYLIISSYGINFLIERVKLKKVLILVLVIYLYSFGYFLQAYLIHFPKNLSESWLYGIKEVNNYINKNNSIQQIFVEDSGQYIYFLFYNNYPLTKYLETVDYRIDGQGFTHVLNFGKFKFEKSISDAESIRNSLYVSQRNNNLSKKMKSVENIVDPSGKISFYLSESI